MKVEEKNILMTSICGMQIIAFHIFGVVAGIEPSIVVGRALSNLAMGITSSYKCTSMRQHPREEIVKRYAASFKGV